ncbi:MAG: hypothetical protein ACR2PI_10740 [Hyphomicrobiaceae bacterium]
MRETLSNVSKLAHKIADCVDGKSDCEFPDLHASVRRIPSAHSRDKQAISSIAPVTRAFDTTPLEAIGAAFDELRDTIPDVREKSAAVLADVIQSTELADKIDEIVQPIEERLLEVAWQSHELPCLTPADLRVKAEILRFVASDEPDDIQSVLTQSLCNDILSRTTKSTETGA